jgi:hypothetical protein
MPRYFDSHGARTICLLAVILAACADASAPGAKVPAAVTVVSDPVGPTAGGFETADSIGIEVTDISGNPIAGEQVSFVILAGGGSVGAATNATGADGVARTSWTVGSTGPQLLRATAGSAHVDITADAITCPEFTLAVGEVRSLAPAGAPCAVLEGNAQQYLVTIVNPANSPMATAAYSSRGIGGVASSEIAAKGPAAASNVAGDGLPESLARARAHASILARNMDLLQRAAAQSRVAPRGTSDIAAATTRPAVGALVPMKLPDITINGCTSFVPVVGRVVYAGARAIILEDTDNALKGQVDTLLARLGHEFDDVMFPLLRTNFGDPLAMDAKLNNDGAIYMFFSTRVNTMGNGQIAGYVNNADFVPAAQCPASNGAEVFYARAPTALGGAASEPIAYWEFTRSIASTIIHESKHLTSFATKLAQPGFSGSNPAQDGWLEESSAEIAQELYDRVTFAHAAKSNAGYTATIAKEVRPSSGMPMNMFNAFSWLYRYVSNPESLSLVGSTGAGDVTFYGSGWAFLRWTIDTYAATEATFLTAMTGDVSHWGIANIETITGKSFDELLSEYSLALALDDYPGFTPADARYSFPSWNLRDIFAGMNADFPNTFATPTPLQLRAQGFGKFTLDVGAVHGGGFSVLQLSGAPADRQLLEFKGANGAAFPAAMRLNIVRVR